MAKINNRKCICCSTEYRYCNTCAEDVSKPLWYSIYHNENCKNIFNTASDYLAGAISKEDAKNKFENCDLSYKDKLHHKIVEAINDTCDAKTSKSVKATKSIVEPIEATTDEIETISIEKVASLKNSKKK